MFKKIICMFLIIAATVQADVPEFPPSIASELKQAGSYLYASAAHAWHSIKNLGHAVPPIFRAGEKGVGNIASFIDRYPAVSAVAATAVAGSIIYYKFFHKKKCMCGRLCRIVCTH